MKRLKVGNDKKSIKCVATTKAGKPCSTYSMANSDYCYRHNPEISNEVKLAVSKKGGTANKSLKRLEAIERKKNDKPMDKALQVRKRLTAVFHAVRRDLMAQSKGKALTTIGLGILKAIEISELEGRLESIERIILERKVIGKTNNDTDPE